MTTQRPKIDATLSRDYPYDFQPDANYRAGMPDLQNGPSALIKGARRRIQHVGIHNFRLPLAFEIDGDTRLLDTKVTGSVSLAADRKGINMSRILRSFYDWSQGPAGFAMIDRIIDCYQTELDALDARLALSVSVPLLRPSLRSGLSGYQYYDATFEVTERAGVRTRILHFDYVYASTCPCSLELAEHARDMRGQLATPHSQRSRARLSMVLVAAHPIFVEDAVRLFAEALENNPAVADFRVIASHQESLHSHDAVSILTQGQTFDAASIDPDVFANLIRC